MTAFPTLRTAVLAATLACISSLPAHALILNGGFESGFSNWTQADQIGSEGTFHLQTGTTSPVTGFTVPPPPEGSTAAMTDAEGPGSHVLYQDFLATALADTTILSFQIFIQNSAADFFTANHLDFATADLNQQARVDILLASSDPFSVSASDVLLNVFQTQPGDPLVSGYTLFSIDITDLLNANLNTPLRLRFAEVDNVFLFQFGVDNVAVGPAQAAPEPATVLLTLAALLGFAWSRLPRRSPEPSCARFGAALAVSVSLAAYLL